MAKLKEAFKYAWRACRDPEAKGERVPLPKGRPKSAEPLFRAQMPVKRHAEGTHASNRLSLSSRVAEPVVGLACSLS